MGYYSIVVWRKTSIETKNWSLKCLKRHYWTVRSMKTFAVLMEDGAFALLFRPYPGGFDSLRGRGGGAGRSWNWLMHFCSDQGYDPCVAFPEWIRSSKKLIFEKNIVMQIKHHFGKSEWLKINLTETMVGATPCTASVTLCSAKLIFLTSWSTVLSRLCLTVPQQTTTTLWLFRFSSK